MIKKFFTSIHNLSIKYKLFAIFLIVITVPFCLFLLVNFFILSKDAKSQALFTANKVLNQTESYLEFKTYSIKSTLNSISYSDIVQSIMNKNTSDYYDDLGLWGYDSTILKKQLHTTASENKDISKIQLYMKQGLASIQETDEYTALKSVEEADWYKKMFDNSDVVKWYPQKYFGLSNKKNYIYATRLISNDINELVGIVKVDIPQDVFNSILDNAPFIKNMSVILINNYDEIISTSDSSVIKDGGKIIDILSDPLAKNINKDIWANITFDKEKNLVGVKPISNTNWKLIFIIPYNSLLESTNNASKQLVFIFLLIVPLSLPLAFYVAAQSTNRIRKLIVNMRKVVKGDFNVSILQSNNDEIGELTQNFNYMLTNISMLIDDKFELGKDVKNMELKALQAQINPHFLYNTLDLIKWMSIKVNAPEIGRVVETLSKFYKLSLSKGADIVLLKSELDHVSTYVQIQNMRFDNCINLIIDISEDLYEFKILKIILQPIIENSILHGIMEKEEEIGTITISGKLLGNTLIIYVSDDGVGIPEDKLPHILTGTLTKDSHGYGIKNINERLKLNYGSEYGLTYKSTVGVGTVVEIKIPAEKM